MTAPPAHVCPWWRGGAGEAPAPTDGDRLDVKVGRAEGRRAGGERKGGEGEALPARVEADRGARRGREGWRGSDCWARECAARTGW